MKSTDQSGNVKETGPLGGGRQDIFNSFPAPFDMIILQISSDQLNYSVVRLHDGLFVRISHGVVNSDEHREDASHYTIHVIFRRVIF